MELSVWKLSINRTFSITLLDCRVVCIKKSILGILHPAVLWAYHLILCVCECVHSVSPSLPSHILLEFAVSNYALHIITVFAAATELVFLIRFFPQAQSEVEATISWLLDIINYYNILQRFCIYSYCIDIQLYIYNIHILHTYCMFHKTGHFTLLVRFQDSAGCRGWTFYCCWTLDEGEGWRRVYQTSWLGWNFAEFYDGLWLMISNVN